MNNSIIDNRSSERIYADFAVEILPDFLGKTIDISETGISFYLSKKLLDNVAYLTIKISQSCFIQTQIDIVWQRQANDENGFIYGANFIYLREDKKEELFNFLHNEFYLKKIVNEQGLNVNFIKIVDQMRKYLMYIEKGCKELEREGKYLLEEQQIMFIKSQQKIFRCLNRFFFYIGIISKDFSLEEFKKHQRYAQAYLLEFFLRDEIPIIKRIYTKPLGYAGDYVVMNYLYEDGYQGQGLYGKLMNRYSFFVSAARAHIYRRFYFNKALREIIQNSKSNSEIRIASFACGPAIEILDVIEQEDLPVNVKFFCIDGEPQALAQFRKRLDCIEQSKGKRYNVEIICENILNMARKQTVYPGLKNFDYIYCAGFLDYLSDRSARIVTHYLFNFLKNLGVMVLVNMYKENPGKVYADFILEWYLRHRDEKQMCELMLGLKDIQSSTIDFDTVAKSNIYLIIKKN